MYSIPKVMHMCVRGISSNNCCGQGTVYNYARNDKEMRTAIGSKVGKPRIMSADNEQLVVDAVRRVDRGNDGKSLREIHDTMQQLQPITEQQARDAFCRTIRSAHKKELTGVVKAQATTTKRSAITVEQQYRWHVFVDAAWAMNKEETGTTLLRVCIQHLRRSCTTSF